MDVADGGEGVVDGPVVAQVPVGEPDPALWFARGHLQRVANLGELRWAVLASRDDLHVRLLVGESEQVTGAGQVLQQAGRERGREDLGWSG